MGKDLGAISGSREPSPSGLGPSGFDPGRELPPRDWRGRFGTVVCVNGHDRCFYGPSLECPYCEVRSGKESA
jgi:hypothetical protein